MKAGTSWWYYLLSQHPQINLGDSEKIGEMKGHDSLFALKERHFFDQFHTSALLDEDMERYLATFPDDGKVTGEWTVCYQYYWWVPALIRSVLPEVKLITILRNPVDRYLEAMQFIQADRRLLSGDQFYRGLYWQQLQNVFRYFNKDRVLVLQYEDLCSDPEDELIKTYRFLGVDPGFMPKGLRKRVNDQEVNEAFLPGYRKSIAKAYEAEVMALVKAALINPTAWVDFRDVCTARARLA